MVFLIRNRKRILTIISRDVLSKQAIEEFQEIYFKKYGLKLTFEEAAEQAAQVLRLYKAVLGKSKINNNEHQRTP